MAENKKYFILTPREEGKQGMLMYEYDNDIDWFRAIQSMLTGGHAVFAIRGVKLLDMPAAPKNLKTTQP